jgi:hypothetical protein
MWFSTPERKLSVSSMKTILFMMYKEIIAVYRKLYEIHKYTERKEYIYTHTYIYIQTYIYTQTYIYIYIYIYSLLNVKRGNTVLTELRGLTYG